ncbi:RnfABCDGE type electron transport complex subunit G [Chloroflexota bacterium]
MKIKALIGVFPIVFITVVVFASVGLVTWTDSITGDKVEEQEKQQIQSMLKEMFPGMSEYTLKDDIYTIYSDGAEVGYAFLAVGKGYGGDIKILVGLEDKTTMKGITVISQTETPGLGSRIAESSFANKFTGLNINDVALKQDGGQIDAITGATISSHAVIDAVSTTAMEKVKSLKGIK